MRALHLYPFPLKHLPPLKKRSLSLQFLLQALLDGLEEIDKEKNRSVPFLLKRMLLLSFENPLGQAPCILDRLCFYFQILVQTSKVRNRAFDSHLTKMKKKTLQIKMDWETEGPLTDQNGVAKELKSFYKKELGQLFTSLFPFFKEAKEDENVLAVLIENKDRLNLHFEEKKVDQILLKLFPKGKKELKKVIQEKYEKRGFSQVFAKLNPLIDHVHI